MTTMARPGRPASEGDEDRDQRLSRALYEIGALWQRVRNLKRDKADTGHDHDGRYVNEDGDTMTGNLDMEGAVAFNLRRTESGTDYRLRVQITSAGTIIFWRYVNGSTAGKIEIQASEIQARDKDFDVVNGTKNALIVDPDDATRRWRFAAVEADEPGLLIHRRTVTIPEGNGGEATVDLPAHWSRIATDGDAMVTPLNDTRDQAPAAAVVDLTVPEVTVRGRPGDYRVWVMAARADAGVRGWTHEVEVTPDDEDEDDTAP